MGRDVLRVALGIAGIVIVGIFAVWLLRSQAPAGAEPGMVRLVEKGMDTAEDARRSERDMLVALDRYWLVGLVLAAGIPLVVALLILRECGRREPKTEEIVTRVSRAMIQAQRLSEGAQPELPAIERKKLTPPT